MVKSIIVLVLVICFVVVASISWADDKKVITTSGTAFVVNAGGYLLTCNHVVSGADSISVTLGGKTYEASILSTDYAHDIALLQIQATDIPSLSFVDSNKVQLGEEVRACGFPIIDSTGTNLKVNRGTIAGINTIRTQKAFQIDAPVNPGNSGGPLINEKGEVVGIINAKLVDKGIENIGFAIPINYVRTTLRDESIDFTVSAGIEKLDGPTLVKKVSPSIALVTVKTTSVDFNDEDYISDNLKTKSVELVDEKGKTRGRLYVGKDGIPGLSFVDAEGNARTGLSLDENGNPYLSLWNSNGKGYINFSMDKSGDPRITFSDTKGKSSGIFQFVNGEPSFELQNAAGKLCEAMSVVNGKPAIILWDNAGQLRGNVSLDEDDAPRIDLLDANGKIREALLMDKDGAPGIWLWDGAGKSSLGLTIDNENAPALTLYDSTGKQRGAVGIGKDGDPGFHLWDTHGEERGAFRLVNADPCLKPLGFRWESSRDVFSRKRRQSIF